MVTCLVLASSMDATPVADQTMKIVPVLVMAPSQLNWLMSKSTEAGSSICRWPMLWLTMPRVVPSFGAML